MSKQSFDKDVENKRYFVSTQNREVKAQKIASVLSDYLLLPIFKGRNILDIGCGIGRITEYFSAENNVYCVDVEDRLEVEKRDRITFDIVSTEKLHHSDNFFDIVISNHVIEHLPDQRLHLSEIYRVLKRNGICYLATPNKNFLVEPHYKIPFIHYLPFSVFHSALRLLGKYKEDLHLLTYGQMTKLFSEQSFMVTEYTSKVMKEPKYFHLDTTWTGFIPHPLLEMLKPFSPTNIFILEKV
jgi:ubiquinone/menaquinone biosynthesis C-methylase UbiE